MSRFDGGSHVPDVDRSRRVRAVAVSHGSARIGSSSARSSTVVARHRVSPESLPRLYERDPRPPSKHFQRLDSSGRHLRVRHDGSHEFLCEATPSRCESRVAATPVSSANSPSRFPSTPKPTTQTRACSTSAVSPSRWRAATTPSSPTPRCTRFRPSTWSPPSPSPCPRPTTATRPPRSPRTRSRSRAFPT